MSERKREGKTKKNRRIKVGEFIERKTLEMCAMLANIQPGVEVIVPSFTFVYTAIAFVRQGAKIVFADSMLDNPNIDVTKIEALITPKTNVRQ